MSAPGWEKVDGDRSGRLRVHTLRAGVFVASITEWLGRPDASREARSLCSICVCGEAGELPLLEEPLGDRLEDDKDRMERKIRQLAREALAALGCAS